MTDNFIANEEELKVKLTEEEYKVLRQKGTEAPFSGKLLHDDRDGMYKCKVCGQDLFSSTAKFESGTGWPSFGEAVPGSVVETEDNALGMIRTEITCSKCGSHLGHVFPLVVLTIQLGESPLMGDALHPIYQ